jgi:membrane protein
VAGTEKHLVEAWAERTRERRRGRANRARPLARVPSGIGRKLGWSGADLLTLFKVTFSRWSDDKVPKLAAALAFYTSFSVAPILFIAIAVAGVLFGADAACDEISREISRLVGARIGEGLETVLKSACQPRSGMHATILGGIALVFGAYGIFGELQDSLNIIWKVKKKEGRGIWAMIRARILSFLLVLVIGFLLLVSLVLTAGFAALWQALLGRGGEGILIGLLDQAFSLLVITALFGAAFKVLPNARTRWRDVGVGAFLTAALFTLGKVLIALYLRRSTAGSVYGAAGSFVLLLLWIYYSSQIFFFGAEFTKTWADTHGMPPRPQDDTISVHEPPLLPDDPHA